MKKGRGLKVGVIGVGFMGENHARILSSLPGAKLYAVFDADPARAQAIAKQYQVLSAGTPAELLELVEAVTVVTPTATHFEVAKLCIEAGRSLLVEKPLAATAREAQNLVTLSENKNLVLAVGFIERFNPAFLELKKLIRKEKVLGVDLKRLSPFPERITDADVVMDMMIHDLDLLSALLPRDEIESIKAEGKKIQSKNLDQAIATLFFRSGVIAKVEANRVFSSKTRKIVVSTENALYEADLLNKQILVRDLVQNLPSVHHVKAVDQLTIELTDFVEAVKSGSRPRVDGAAGYRASLLAEEVIKACS
jgi:predicted dehydrogenase